MTQKAKKAKKVIILAGGQKTRLIPLINFSPIWMFPVLNKPLIEHTIDFFKKNDFEDIVITLPQGEKIPDHLKQNKVSTINYFKEDRPRGTAGALKDLEEYIGKEPFLVINSNLFVGNIDLAKFIEFHMETESVVTVGVYRDNSSNGVVENITINDDKTIKSFHTIHSSMDRRSPWRSSGIYFFDSSVLRFINQRNYMDIKEQLIPLLQKEGLKVSAYKIEDFHLCLNDINDYINLHRDLLLKDSYMNSDYMDEIAEGVWAGENVKLSPKAYLLGPIIIGEGSEIQNWAQIIGPTVIGPSCQIPEGVFIRESILWGGVSLSNRSRIEYSLIAKSSNMPNNFSIKNMIILNGLSIGDANLITSDYSIKGIVDLSNISIGGSSQKIYKIAKRIMDIALSAMGIILLLPLFLLVAVMIKIDSPGPVLYVQKRCGMKGKLFNMLKFRTMVINAENLQKSLIPKKQADSPIFKILHDPRVTKLGRVLRKISLDEIPQLFNVLKGEMSLVGPRPLIMDEMKFSQSWRETRLKVKPGITGLWQIQGRSKASFHDWIRYDIYYVKNQSLWLDIKILLKTIKVVLKRSGAW